MIAYRVVAVPERLERAQHLAARIGAQVVLDEDHEGPFATHRRALASAAGASHVVVVEDDAIPCRDFRAHVAMLVDQRPDHLLGLYVGREHPRHVQDALTELTPGVPAWLDDPHVRSGLWWGVGYVMPTADLPDVLDWLTITPNQHRWLHTDVRIGMWHAARDRLSYPLPSPLNHDDDLPSTTSTHRRGRVAWNHCAREEF